MASTDFLVKYLEANDPEEKLFDESEFETTKALIEKRLRILTNKYEKLTHREKCVLTLRLASFGWILRSMIKGINEFLASLDREVEPEPKVVKKKRRQSK